LQCSAHIGDDAGLEHEERQKDVYERRRADRQLDKDIGEGIGPGGPAEVRQDGGKAPQGHPNHPEQHGWRQLQIGGERLAKADDDEQRRDNEQDESGVEHRRRSPLGPEMAGGSDAALLGRILP